MALPQWAIAHFASHFATSTNVCRASSYGKECSSATPFSKADCAPGCVCRLRRGTLRPRQATKEQGSSGQSYVLHIVPHFAVADFKLEQLLAGSQSCLSNPQRLDAGPEWEDNTGWSGTSKQVRTRKPFEP
jgi:hypothetical protein